MKINYTIRKEPNWEKIKIGDKVIIYEGFNTEDYQKKWGGKEGVVSKIDPKYRHQPYFEVTYPEDSSWPAYIYPYNCGGELFYKD